jgi:hypothetical protein
MIKRYIAATLSILAVSATFGWKLASHRETSAGLSEISLKQHSEHSNPGPTNKALAPRVRVRVMASDGYEISATADKVPQIALTAE